MSYPLVSILIPVYNREKFVVAAIESALQQTCSNLEIVVVDNASTDGTWAACRAIASLDERVRLYRNDANLGPVRNWRRCIELARGEYAKILWSDDLLTPDFIWKTLPFLTDNSDIGFVVTNVKILDESTGKQVNLRSRLSSGCYTSSLFINGVLLGYGFPRSPGCALFRTKDLATNLLPQIPNRLGSDFSMHAIGNDLLLFLLTAHVYQRFAWLDESLVIFRSHFDSITKRTEQGHLELLYDVAKAYYVESCVNDDSLKQQFNAKLKIDLFLYRKNCLGIERIDDFYSQTGHRPVNSWYILKYIANKLRKELF